MKRNANEKLVEHITKEEFMMKLQDYVKHNNEQPDRHNHALGLIVDDCSCDERLTADYIYNRVDPQHLNPYGSIHGGIVASIFDYAIGITAASAVDRLVTTTDLSVSYLRALMGQRFRVHVDLTHIGNKMINGFAEIHDEDSGDLCATCMGSYLLINFHGKSVKL